VDCNLGRLPIAVAGERGVSMCVRVSECVWYVCVCMCVCACLCVCVYVCVCIYISCHALSGSIGQSAAINFLVASQCGLMAQILKSTLFVTLV